MAIYVPLQKVAETDTTVDYHFGVTRYVPDEERTGRWRPSHSDFGRIQFDKMNGDYSLIFAMPGDDEHKNFARAVNKVRKHWIEGEFPAETCFAA